MNYEEVRSPCVSICVLSDDDICQGCFRNAQEITDWFMSTNEDKQAILERAAQRRQASFTVKLS